MPYVRPWACLRIESIRVTPSPRQEARRLGNRRCKLRFVRRNFNPRKETPPMRLRASEAQMCGFMSSRLPVGSGLDLTTDPFRVRGLFRRGPRWASGL